MYTYICFLRAINVGGKNSLKMSDLSNALSQLKFNNIKTYLQSGNFIFSSKSNNTSLIEQEIELLILKQFNITTIALLYTKTELIHILDNTPFVNKNLNSLYFTFLKKTNRTLINQDEIHSNYAPDLYIIKNEIVYIHCESGYGKTKLTNSFFEKQLQTQATTRNYNTMLNLIALSDLNME
jgi:uncharacterized protein (DUF1697 family)